MAGGGGGGGGALSRAIVVRPPPVPIYLSCGTSPGERKSWIGGRKKFASAPLVDHKTSSQCRRRGRPQKVRRRHPYKTPGIPRDERQSSRFSHS